MRSKGGWVGEKTRLLVDFRIWWLSPFTIASPMRCVVVIEGVGAVWVCPKNWRSRWGVVVAFQWWSAVWSIPKGDGKLVARWYMALAFGRLGLNCFRGGICGCGVP